MDLATYILAFGVACGVLIGFPAFVYSTFHPGVTEIVGTLVVVAILVAAVFPPLLRASQRLLDRYAYRASYDQSKTLTHVTRKLSSFLERQALLRYIRSVVNEAVPSESVSFYLPSSGGYSY